MPQFTIERLGSHFRFKKTHKFRVKGTNLGSVGQVTIAEGAATAIAGYHWDPSMFSPGDSSNSGEFGVSHDGNFIIFFATLTANMMAPNSGGIIPPFTGGGDGTLTVTLNPVAASGNTPVAVDTPSSYSDPAAFLTADERVSPDGSKTINVTIS